MRWKAPLSAGLWLAVAALILFAPLPLPTGAPQERVLKVQASQYRFEPGSLQVNPGDRVTIELESQDVVHGLSLDGYGVQVTAAPGQTARLSFTADKAGVYRFRCPVACGNMHPFMIGKLQVGPNTTLLRAAGLALLAAAGGWALYRRKSA